MAAWQLVVMKVRGWPAPARCSSGRL